MKINLKKTTNNIIDMATTQGWEIDRHKKTINGSVYIDIYRFHENKKEWATIRVSDHKQAYQNFLYTYSVSPSEISIETLKTILNLPFGAVGDIL